MLHATETLRTGWFSPKWFADSFAIKAFFALRAQKLGMQMFKKCPIAYFAD